MTIVFHVCFFDFSDLEWKIIYVGSAESMQHDQVLDSVLVGPIPAGSHMFVFQVVHTIFTAVLILLLQNIVKLGFVGIG